MSIGIFTETTGFDAFSGVEVSIWYPFDWRDFTLQN